MPTVVYKAHSRLDLRDARTALTRAGIAAQTIGDPDMHCAPGTKVSYFVELAVDDADVERARAVLAARDRAGEGDRGELGAVERRDDGRRRYPVRRREPER